MTTETTQLPPCPLEGCEAVEHHWHSLIAQHDILAVVEACKSTGGGASRCYGPHRPATPQWQPIEYDQIKAGMRIRATVQYGDRATAHIGVAHHQVFGSRVWCTKERWPLDGWGYSATYEVDPSTIPDPDPDAELIEKIGKAIHDADESAYGWGEGGDEWGEDGTEDAYRKLARVALNAVRESEVEA